MSHATLLKLLTWYATCITTLQTYKVVISHIHAMEVSHLCLSTEHSQVPASIIWYNFSKLHIKTTVLPETKARFDYNFQI